MLACRIYQKFLGVPRFGSPLLWENATFVHAFVGRGEVPKMNKKGVKIGHIEWFRAQLGHVFKMSLVTPFQTHVAQKREI